MNKLRIKRATYGSDATRQVTIVMLQKYDDNGHAGDFLQLSDNDFKKMTRIVNTLEGFGDMELTIDVDSLD